ncbi:M23 family metallopeptidase [Rhodococcus aetherivorans]
MVTGTYTFTSGFGPRWGGQHNGVDLAAPIGTPFYAPMDGIVVAAGDSGPGDEGGFDNWIIVDSVTSNGQTLSTVYGHMYPDGVLIDVGDEVRAGDLIGAVGNAGGSTGPHLHFEVWPGGRLDGGSPIDPMGWLADAGELDAPEQGQIPPNVRLVAAETSSVRAAPDWLAPVEPPSRAARCPRSSASGSSRRHRPATRSTHPCSPPSSTRRTTSATARARRSLRPGPADRASSCPPRGAESVRTTTATAWQM